MNRQLAKLGFATLLVAGMSSAAYAQADNSNSKVAPAASFSGWMTDYSKTNQGRISREAYMQESGRRWDAMDKEQKGLTPDQVNTIYGYPSAGAMPNTKDNMTSPSSPNNVKK
jgi:Spy/CpxP family protein refolding chaperone